MIDIHAHILPGIDDGARDIYDTLEMAEIAVKSGITTVVATPHSNIPGIYENYFGKAYLEAYEKVVDALVAEKIPLKVLPGMEVFATHNLPELLVQKKIMPINQSRYVLIEFAFEEDPMFATDVLRRVSEIGAKPVIAHVERYQFIQDNPQIAYSWCKSGYVLQGNKASYEGKFGERVKTTLDKLFEHNLISVMASDAHRADIRTPYMQNVYEQICVEHSVIVAERLFLSNPQRICKNIPVWNKEAISF